MSDQHKEHSGHNDQWPKTVMASSRCQDAQDREHDVDGDREGSHDSVGPHPQLGHEVTLVAEARCQYCSTPRAPVYIVRGLKITPDALWAQLQRYG